MTRVCLLLSVFLSFTSQDSDASIKTGIKDYCDGLKVGNSLSIEQEKEKLKSFGFTVDTALASEAGHDTRMLMITSKSKLQGKCDVLIRDGRIAEVRK